MTASTESERQHNSQDHSNYTRYVGDRGLFTSIVKRDAHGLTLFRSNQHGYC
jgi:hypothetical protein